VSEAGHRCPTRRRLEFDHVQEVARGGSATASNLRLRCRAHNQYGAERTFGSEFMRQKREAARAVQARGREAKAREAQCASAQVARARRQEAEAHEAQARQRETEAHEAQRMEAQRMAALRRAAAEEVVTPLRLLGFTPAEVRRAVVQCESMPEASLEQRVRVALSCLVRPGVRIGRPEPPERPAAFADAPRNGDEPGALRSSAGARG
jgi:hypothetical protein